MEALESMIQEVELELVGQEIPGCTRVTTSKVVADCILFSRESYSARLRSTEPVGVVELVEASYGAGEDGRIRGDPVLSSIYADEVDKAHAGFP